MESTRIAKLEELLARVRANAALGHPPRVASALAPSASDGTNIGAWATRAVVEAVDADISEIDRTALRHSLERHVELALGDETPGVPFAEETDGWEPDRLELEDDDGPRLLRAREAEVPLVTAFPTQPAPPPSVLPAAFAKPPPTTMFAAPEEPPRRGLAQAGDEDDHLDEEPLYPAGMRLSEDLHESVLGEVLARAARHADGEIDPRAIWDGLAGQLRGRRASSSGIQVPRVGETAPRPEPQPGAKGTTLPSMPSVRLPERTEIALETATPAPSIPAAVPAAPGAPTTPATPLAAAMPAAPSTPLPRASRPSLELDVEHDVPPDLDFDDEPGAPTASDSSRLRPKAAPTSRPNPSSRGRSMRPSAPEFHVAVLRATDDLHDGGNDDARPSRKRLMRTGRHHRLPPRRERRRPWLWILAALGIGAATALGLAFAFGKIGPASVPGVARTTTPAPLSAAPAGPSPTVERPSLVSTAPTRETTAAPVASLVSPTLAPPGAPSTDDLKADEGYLRVDGDPSLAVYLNGNLAGQATEWIRTTCGIRHLRLARRDPPQPGASFPKWLDAGNSLVIPCRGATVVIAPLP